MGLHPVVKAGKHVVAAWGEQSLPLDCTASSFESLAWQALAGRSFAFVRIPVEDAQTCEALLPREAAGIAWQ